MSLELTIYNGDCLNLAKSILLKSDQLAREVEYSIDPSLDLKAANRREWKYYLNIAGEYHATDIPMSMVSLDTLQSIELQKDVLKDHPITLSRLRQFGAEYEQLVATYPYQTALIQGLVYGLDIDTVLDAAEFEILGYNKTLVEIQEINLIPQLQQYITHIGRMIASNDFVDVERGYATVQMYKMFQLLDPAIKLIRFKNHLTAHAHSYFIWTHINQRVYLEDLKSLFTTKEVIYLYKNIDRLLDFSGTKGVLDELFQEFITVRSITGYNLNVSKDVDTIKRRSELELKYVNQGINTKEDRIEAQSTILNAHGVRSRKQLDDYGVGVIKAMSGGNDTVITREITLVDDTTEVSSTRALLTAVDLSYLLMSNYTKSYNVVNHITGDTYNLSYRECCILYLRLCQTRMQEKTQFIPKFFTHQVPKATAPLKSELLKKYDITESAVDELLLKAVMRPTFTDDDVKAGEFKRGFIWWIKELNRIVTQQYVFENTHTLPRIYDEFVETVALDLVPTDDVDFDAWMVGKNISLVGLEDVDLALMEDQILTEVFKVTITEGADTTVSRLKDFLTRFVTYRTNIDTLLVGSTDVPSGILPVMAASDSPIALHPAFYNLGDRLTTAISSPELSGEAPTETIGGNTQPNPTQNFHSTLPYLGFGINPPVIKAMEQTLILDI